MHPTYSNNSCRPLRLPGLEVASLREPSERHESRLFDGTPDGGTRLLRIKKEKGRRDRR
ncbi:MAG: hypothetical protein NT154_15625 [Verrucomicrobia bacterium]|nr:hypothetical protein [Verrucomicrobiota bacterium]